ncbi:hypothetical protein CVT26_010236 [Gymnopilus dilepis]|uniref:Uncharacterized protein n=1 Tax=Gymnopilus dilepis TaxID=231916 RepID=A0A409Y194_9AGAR|nr:hypothetical protein CVT26_010236 [Gymnopilus dilepis]
MGDWRVETQSKAVGPTAATVSVTSSHDMPTTLSSEVLRLKVAADLHNEYVSQSGHGGLYAELLQSRLSDK